MSHVDRLCFSLKKAFFQEELIYKVEVTVGDKTEESCCDELSSNPSFLLNYESPLKDFNNTYVEIHAYGKKDNDEAFIEKGSLIISVKDIKISDDDETDYYLENGNEIVPIKLKFHYTDDESCNKYLHSMFNDAVEFNINSQNLTDNMDTDLIMRLLEIINENIQNIQENESSDTSSSSSTSTTSTSNSNSDSS